MESPVLLLDLGLLAITSTPKVKSRSPSPQDSPQKATLSKRRQSTEKGEKEEPSGIQPNEVQKGDSKQPKQRAQETDAANTEFYDEFHLSMSNIQIVLINKVNLFLPSRFVPPLMFFCYRT